jgi:hypothetical protein
MSFAMTRPILSLLLLALVFALHVRGAHSQTPSENSQEHKLRMLQDRYDRGLRTLQDWHDHNMRMLNHVAKGSTPDARDLEMQKQSHWHSYDDMRSKMGFMRYCGEKNLLDPKTVSKAGDIYSRYVAYTFYDPSTAHQSYNRESGDEAERQGSLGIIYDKDWIKMFVHEDLRLHPHGKSLDGYATLNAATPAAVCQKWANETSGLEEVLAMNKGFDEAKRKIDEARKALKPADNP